jgi:S-adenosylmethionine-diacylglycerol 3-amino-3-carboxypropyl transferase
VKQWLFNQIHARSLVYNQCWEDPVVDKQALNIRSADRIVMITSAGCNALDYVLNGPERIDCVDLNPHQTALLELKLAAIRSLEYSDFFAMFGEGRIHGHRSIYRRNLRYCLSARSRRIWDKRIDYFDGRGRGLYFHGTAGLFAQALHWYIQKSPRLRRDIERIQRICDLNEQAEFYRSKIAPRFWSPALRWILRRQAALSLLGVPAEQVRQICETANMSLSAFIEGQVERVFTEFSLQQNYFWRVYLNGRYTHECCPNYLKAENFERLRALCNRIHTHTMLLTDYLRFSGDRFSIYVLLDHMDWLASSEVLLQEEWKAILNSAMPGARIIFRSGGISFDHLPEFAKERIVFQQDVASALHRQDRVGTYGSFYLASVTA